MHKFPGMRLHARNSSRATAFGKRDQPYAPVPALAVTGCPLLDSANRSGQVATCPAWCDCFPRNLRFPASRCRPLRTSSRSPRSGLRPAAGKFSISSARCRRLQSIAVPPVRQGAVRPVRMGRSIYAPSTGSYTESKKVPSTLAAFVSLLLTVKRMRLSLILGMKVAFRVGVCQFIWPFSRVR